MAAPEVITFGCRLNIYESEVIKAHSQAASLHDVIIFNTCAVTAEAERQARQAIRKARRENPHKKIIVTGCSAQITPQIYAQMPEVDQVIGNTEKMQISTYASEQPRTISVSDIMAKTTVESHVISSFEAKTRAYVQIQNGCDHRCTFCTIPYGRGNSRSVPMGVLFDQIAKFMEQDIQEIVLTGVDITSYGHDLPGTPTLGQILRRLLHHFPTLARLRLSSVDPVEIDDDVFHVLATESRFMPHLHISLQAGDDLILKRMKRRHLRHHLLLFCERARKARPEVTFGADIIAGFPTEKEDHFRNTLNIIRDCDLTFSHIFPYSPRPGTPASRMPQVQRTIIKDRARQLREEAKRLQREHFQRYVGTTQEVLVEKDGKGRTPHFIPVFFSPSLSIGQIVPLKCLSATDQGLRGELV